jgi:hypothetical protein
LAQRHLIVRRRIAVRQTFRSWSFLPGYQPPAGLPHTPAAEFNTGTAPGSFLHLCHVITKKFGG